MKAMAIALAALAAAAPLAHPLPACASGAPATSAAAPETAQPPLKLRDGAPPPVRQWFEIQEQLRVERQKELEQAERRLAQAEIQRKTVYAHQVEEPKDGSPRYAGRQYKNVRLATQRMESDRQRWDREVERLRALVKEKRQPFEESSRDDKRLLLYPPLHFKAGAIGSLERFRVISSAAPGIVLCETATEPPQLFLLNSQEVIAPGEWISGEGKLLVVTDSQPVSIAETTEQLWVVQMYEPVEWLEPE
jgi:hypothetical protein